MKYQGFLLAAMLQFGAALGVHGAAVSGTVVEYRNTLDFPRSPGGQFFYTADPLEQAAVDAGLAGRFQRTGVAFSAGGDTNLCRFYGSVTPGPNSHFFTADAGECAFLRSLQRTPTPADVKQWNYEGTGFKVVAPVAGACPTDATPIYRAYNNGWQRGMDSNHRFTPDRQLLDALVRDSGWVYEGVAFCAPVATLSVAPYPAGLSEQTITVGGVTRQYRVHVPASLVGAPRAIVLVLHGGGGTGLDVANQGAHPLSVFRTVADREAFVVVYPGGLPARDGETGWDDCRGDNLVASGADDVGFLAALIERVRGQYGLPASNVFMAGGSNGAMMTHAFAIARPGLVGAVATSAGSLAANPKLGLCAMGPEAPLPIMIAHGTADTQMPYGGGCVANLGGNCNRGRVISAEATRDRWLAANGLGGVVPTQRVVAVASSGGGPANRFDYAGPVPLRWWRLDGAGHTVASQTVLVSPNAVTGIQNRDVEFAEIAWDFFRPFAPPATFASQPPSTERQVLATTTDSRMTPSPSGVEAPHVVLNPSPTATPRSKLFVFLPGTQGRPSQYSYVLRAAAGRGLHAVGLNYPNAVAMGSLCQVSADPECYWLARRHVIFGSGSPVPGQPAVSPADSIVNRLNQLIIWLNANHPREGWGQYLLADQTVNWSKVVMAGHSQGGGHAGVLAKSFAFSRAVYFSAPEDWNEVTNEPASWTRIKANVTPASLQFGFGSDADTLVPNAHAFAHWDNLGLSKPVSGPVLVEATAPPFSGAQQLRTAIPPNPASTALTPALRNHGVTVVDTSTPLDGSGKPLFDVNGVWDHLCFN